MNRFVVPLMICLIVGTLPMIGPAAPITDFNGEIPVTTEGLVQNNTSTGMKVWLAAPMGPPFFESEDYLLQVYARLESYDPLENISIDVVMGVDAVASPQYENWSYGETMDPSNGWKYYWGYLGMTEFRPFDTSRMLLGQVTYANETVNLTYEMEVLPARARLYTQRVYEPNRTGDPELLWTALDVEIFNFGGLGVTDLVVDLVYADRIVSTHHIPVIVGMGNYTISTSVLPIYGEPAVEVLLVQGHGAPSRLGWAELEVLPRTILDVVNLEASPDVIESGERVRIEAVVQNRGNATSKGQVVELLVDGSIVANETIEGLGPGNRTTVSTRLVLKGEGLHTISAVAEGDDFAAQPISVDVKRPSPTPGAWTLLVAVLLVSLAARRSRPARRA